MSFNLVNQNVVRVRPEEIEVTYSGEAVTNLTVTNVVFWNAGREPIRSQDIPPHEPLSIQPRDGIRILDAEVTQRNNPANDLRSNLVDSNCIILSFDYLDKDEGCVIQIFHTGRTSKDLEKKGKIIGASGLLEPPYNRFRSLRSFLALISINVIALCSILLIFANPDKRLPLIIAVGVAVVTIILVALFGFFHTSSRIRGVPQSLSTFEQLWT